MEFSIRSISDLEKLSHAVKWQYFEKLVAFIFDQNDFDTKQNIVMKTSNGKRQFDVVAKKYGTTYLVECKKWRGRSERAHSLKTATKKHLERCELYAIATGEKIQPIIVTLLEGDIEETSGVPIVPVTKLNWFLNNE